MKHKHADMIKAKADNMELVVFSKFEDKDWIESRVDWVDSFSFLDEYHYFACLPQHKNECLHWLNNGDDSVECKEPNGELTTFISIEAMRDWYTLPHYWTTDHGFMTDELIFRIKPKKVKRWIAVGGWAGESDYVAPRHFASKQECEKFWEFNYPHKPQFIEIEVEQ